MQEVGDCFTFLAARTHNWVCFRTCFPANGHLKASDIGELSFGCDFPTGSKLTTILGVVDPLYFVIIRIPKRHFFVSRRVV